MVKWFDCFNNWVVTWRLGAWGHPRAPTTDSQLLDVDHSHGWHSLATLPSAPTEEGRKAGTHHTDKSGGKGWLEMRVYGKTNPMHKKCQCLNWFLNPLKDALHTLYPSQTPKTHDLWSRQMVYNVTAHLNGCSSFAYSVKLHLTALKLYSCF